MIRRTTALLLGVLLGACAPGSVDAPATTPTTIGAARACPLDDPAPTPPSGQVTVAYPDEPAAFHPAFHQDAAAVDLAALWGLPLYAHDEDGQLEPVLVREAVVLGASEQGWDVRLTLCPGTWSDGSDVLAADVVATIEALRDSPSPWLVEDVVAARVDGPDVAVTFSGRLGRWQHVLADLGPILPAGPLAELGLEAWRDDVPVSGGAFALEAVEPGHLRRFRAHPGSPVGAPVLERVEVLVVPRFELALGLLDDGRADVSLGHLALEGGPRIDAVEGIDGEVARGNSVLTWRWNDPGTRDADARRRVVDGLDLRRFAEGLLGDEGGLVRSFTPGVLGPDVAAPERLDDLGELVVGSPRWHDLPSLVNRGARDALERRGMTVRTASDEADVLARSPIGDATIVIRRLGSWPAVDGLLEATGDPTVLAGDRGEVAASSAAEAAATAVWALGLEVPLVEVGVAHAWAPQRVGGVRPSAWPGLAFVGAREWVRVG